MKKYSNGFVFLLFFVNFTLLANQNIEKELSELGEREVFVNDDSFSQESSDELDESSDELDESSDESEDLAIEEEISFLEEKFLYDLENQEDIDESLLFSYLQYEFNGNLIFPTEEAEEQGLLESQREHMQLLHLLAFYGHEQSLKYMLHLLKEGKDIGLTRTDSEGWTALNFARLNHQQRSIELLAPHLEGLTRQENQREEILEQGFRPNTNYFRRLWDRLRQSVSYFISL